MSGKRERFEKEREKYLSLTAQNFLHQDSVLVQTSGVLLAILAAFGKNVIVVNKIFSTIAVICLSFTIVAVIVGYRTSTIYFSWVQRKIYENYSNSIDLSYGLEESKLGKFNDKLNVIQLALFLIGIISFMVLVLIYIRKI